MSEPILDLDASTLDVNRRRNRLRLFVTLVTAVFLYWLAVMIAAVVLGLVLALKILAESGEVPDSLDELQFLGIGLAAVAVIAAIIGSVVAGFRLPLQRRRLEQQVLAESAAQVIDDEVDDTTVRRVRNILDDDVSKLVGKLPFWASGRLRRWAMRDAAFERDKAAVRFTRNPTALLHALETIAADPREVQRVSAATAPLWFEVPERIEDARATLDERIAALETLGGR